MAVALFIGIGVAKYHGAPKGKAKPTIPGQLGAGVIKKAMSSIENLVQTRV